MTAEIQDEYVCESKIRKIFPVLQLRVFETLRYMHHSIVSILSHLLKSPGFFLWPRMVVRKEMDCLFYKEPNTVLSWEFKPFSFLHFTTQHTKAINRRQPLRYQLESYEQPTRKQTRPVEIDDIAIKVVWKRCLTLHKKQVLLQHYQIVPNCCSSLKGKLSIARTNP